MRHPMRTMAVILLASLAIGGVPAAGLANEAVLVRDGRVHAVVIVTEELREQNGPFAGDEPAFVEIAVAELEEHLALLGEGELAVRYAPAAEAVALAAGYVEAGRTPIMLGGPALDEGLRRALIDEVDDRMLDRDPLVLTKSNSNLDPAVVEHGLDPESFALRVEQGQAIVLGVSPKGTLNGVYALLEQLGFRWYMPGAFGRVVPEGRTHALEAQETAQVPSFNERRVTGALEHDRTWQHRMRVSASATEWTIGHGMPAPEFEAHPDFFALRDGERRERGSMCVSNLEYVEWMAEHYRRRFRENPEAPRRLALMPRDGSSHCECEKCAALDPAVHAALQTPGSSKTDRYIWFNNQVLERLEDEFPDVRAGFLIYAGVMDPPVNVKPSPRIYGSIAEIHVCRLHGPGNPNCPESDYLLWLMEQWGPDLAWFRNSGYWFNLACPGLPNMMISRIRDEIPLIHKHGSIGIRRSAGRFWATEGPSLYLAMKLKWNVNADMDALLEEFFEKFYGPAAAPMQRYTMLLDRAMYEADHHTGRSWDLLRIYDESVRAEARAALAEARELASEGSYATRVEVASKGWAFFESFAKMVEARRAHDFVSAKRWMDETHRLIDELTNDYEIPMLRTAPGSVTSKRFFQLFYGRVTEQGYERVTDGNELVVGLSPKWEFLLEPQGMVGERIGLYEPHKTGGNWQTIDTYSSWGNQGLRYYFGQAWYRQRVTVPEAYAGGEMKLWFAQVDSTAKVWLNGELLGTNPGGEFDIDAHAGTILPFEFDVSDVVRAGEENVIVLRTARPVSNELGTGGLMGPVMFYAAPE